MYEGNGGPDTRCGAREDGSTNAQSRDDGRKAVLEVARRAVIRQPWHGEARIEAPAMKENPLDDVGVSALMHPVHDAGLVERGVGALQAFAAPPEPVLPAPNRGRRPVGTHGGGRREFAPAAAPRAKGARQVAAKPEVRQPGQGLVAVISDNLDVTTIGRPHCFDLLADRHQRLDRHPGVAGTGVVDLDAEERAGRRGARGDGNPRNPGSLAHGGRAARQRPSRVGRGAGDARGGGPHHGWALGGAPEARAHPRRPRSHPAPIARAPGGRATAPGAPATPGAHGHMQPTNNDVRRDASLLECSGDRHQGLVRTGRELIEATTPLLAMRCLSGGTRSRYGAPPQCVRQEG